MRFYQKFCRGQFFFSFLSLIFFTTTISAANNIASPNAVASARQLDAIDRFDQLADSVMRTGQVTGLATVVVHKGRVVSIQGRGTRDVNTYAPVTPDSVFRLASLSKGFASTLAAKLVEENALDWNDRVQDFLPEFKLKDMQSASRLSIEDLLSQRVGLPMHAFDKNLEQDVPVHQLVEQLATLDPICPIGECYGYQNITFNLIHDITFAATGDFFSHQVEKRLFQPLNMRTATYGREALEASAEFSRPHRQINRRWVSLRPNENYYRIPAAAGANASIRDLSQWLIAQMGYRPDVLPVELLNNLHRARVKTPEELRSSSWRKQRLYDANYALGWRIYSYAGHPVVFHAGAVQGFRAVIAILPDQELGVAMLWNCESNLPAGLVPSLFDRALGLSPTDWLRLDRFQSRRNSKLR